MKNQKTVFQYLLTIPGFGHTRAKQLLTSLGIALSTRMKGITLDTYGKTNKPTVISSKKNKAKLYLDQAKLTWLNEQKTLLNQSKFMINIKTAIEEKSNSQASLGVGNRVGVRVVKRLTIHKERLLLQALAALRKSSSWAKFNTKPCSFQTEKILLKEKSDNILNYIQNLSYRGWRLKYGYPLGGRTRSNAQTARNLKINTSKPVKSSKTVKSIKPVKSKS